MPLVPEKYSLGMDDYWIHIEYCMVQLLIHIFGYL